MTLPIKIFDPNDKPFGCLSNNYIHTKYDKSLGGCRTLTNYIYSNCLTERINKQLMCTVKTDVKEFFLKKREEEIKSKIRSAILTALKVKLANPSLAKLLLETAIAPLTYVSSNPFLGNGERGDGDNWYGKSLEQIRLELRNEENKHKTKLAKSDKDKLIYDTWIAHKKLLYAIQSQDNNLQNFLNLTVSEINKAIEVVPGANIVIDKFLEQYKRGNFKYITKFVEHPEILVHEIRREEIAGLRERMTRKRNKIIFDMYADYLLNRKFDGVDEKDYKKAKEQEFAGNDYDLEANNLEDRLYKLYEQGMLSASLSDKIEQTFKKYLIPTEDDVEKAIEYDFPISAMSDSVVKSSDNLQKPNQKFIYLTLPMENTDEDRQLQKLSPVFYDGTMLKIELLLFPSVTHYISAKLIQYVSGVTLQEARSYLLIKPDQKESNFFNPDKASDIYDNINYKSYERNLIAFAKKGLEIKFENRVFQDFLLATGNYKIIYNDLSDDILGLGNKSKGKNIIGIYMVELRERIQKQRSVEKLHMLSTGDITWIFENNNFMKDWIYRRVKDSCNTMKIMKKYLKDKHKIEGSFTPEFTRIVLDVIYQPCSQIYGAVKEITASVPEYFNQMVKQECDSKTSFLVVDILWKRLAVIIYYLIEHMDKTNTNIQNISSEIGRVQAIASNYNKCEQIIPNQYDNCIVSAIINLLRRIVQFNNQISKEDKDITEIDVKCATQIILNTLSTDKKKPISKIEKIDGIDENEKWWDDFAKQVIDKDVQELNDEEVNDEEIIDDSMVVEESGFDDDKSENSDNSDNSENDQYGEGEEDEYSPHTINKISEVLSTIEEVKDVETIAHSIEAAVEIIKKSKWFISKQVIQNRINFFATHT